MIRLIPISTGRKWIKILIRQNVAVRSKSNTNRISCFSLCFTKMITRKGQKVILLSDQVQNHISLWSVDYHLRATLKQLSASSTSCSYRTSRVLFKCDHQVYVISCATMDNFDFIWIHSWLRTISAVRDIRVWFWFLYAYYLFVTASP